MLDQLVADRLIRGGRVLAPEIDEVDEQTAALDVGQELVPQAGAPSRPLDQAGNVGQHQLSLVRVDGPQCRLEGGERVLRHLRRGPRQAAQQRGLARVGLSHEPGVGEHLESKLDPPRLPLEARQRHWRPGYREATVTIAGASRWS